MHADDTAHYPGQLRPGGKETRRVVQLSCPEQRRDLFEGALLRQTYGVVPTIIQPLFGNEREGRVEHWRAPVQGIAGRFSRVAALRLALCPLLHIFTQVELLAGRVTDGLRANEAPAHIGVERRLFDAEQGRGFFGSEIACGWHSSISQYMYFLINIDSIY